MKRNMCILFVCLLVFVSACENSQQSNASTQVPVSSESETSVDVRYIGNINSKIFHLPSCHTLPKEENQVEFQTYDEAIEQGYIPCKKCKPQ